jgi:D-alanyl-D-alanine carboxypeptidase (penicillin-binding protein 5/6)
MRSYFLVRPFHMQFALCTLAILVYTFFPSELSAKKLAVAIQAESGIVMNADTGAILFEKKAHNPHLPASIAKVATALYALNNITTPLDVIVTADRESVSTVTDEAMRRSNYTLPPHQLISDASSAGIKVGEELSLKDLFYGLLLVSGGDASNVIAKHVGGTIPNFMAGLNAYIKTIGCTSSNFCNPSGLHHPKQVTTAYDMALITKEALKNPVFREIVSTVRYTRPKTNKQEAAPWIQGNKLLRSGPYFYPKAIGVKTGYYSLANSTLVAAAKDGDRTLIVVLLKVKERKDLFLDAIKLFEAAFAQPKVQKMILKNGMQNFPLDLTGADRVVGTYTLQDLSFEYYPAEEPIVKCFLQWDRELSLPITKDQHVGELVLLDSDGRVLKKESLYAAEGASATFAHRTQVFFSKWIAGITFGKIAIVAIIAALIAFFIFRKRRQA